jgi:hypothetical protein
LYEELCLRRQRTTLPALLSAIKSPGIWAAIAADLLPDGANLRHVVLPFIPDSSELASIVLGAFGAGITSMEVTFPPPAHYASPYQLDLSDWTPQEPRVAKERVVLWIKCGPDTEGLVIAPRDVDLGIHPLTGVHVPGVQVRESRPVFPAANDAVTVREPHEVLRSHSRRATGLRRIFRKRWA